MSAAQKAIQIIVVVISVLIYIDSYTEWNNKNLVIYFIMIKG